MATMSPFRRRMMEDMTIRMRPALEVADISRRSGEAFRAAQGSRLSPDQRRVMAAIEVCRTAALGGAFTPNA